MKGWTWLLLVPLLVAGAFYGHDLLLGLHRPYGPGAPSPKWPELGTPWAMWPVDNPGDWLPNGLDLADVDGDGLPDLLVNYEFRGRIRVVLHPGPDLTRDRFWPAIDVGYFPNAESAAFGDLDGDGAVDVVVVQGIEHHGDPSAVRILWGRRGAFGGGTGAAPGEPRPRPVPGRPGRGRGRRWLPGHRRWRPGRAPGRGPADRPGPRGLVRTGLRWFRNPRGDGRDPGTWGPGPSSPSTPRSQAATGSS